MGILKSIGKEQISFCQHPESIENTGEFLQAFPHCSISGNDKIPKHRACVSGTSQRMWASQGQAGIRGQSWRDLPPPHWGPAPGKRH